MIKRLVYKNFKLVYRLSQWIRRRFTPAGLLILSAMVAAGVFGIDTRRTMAFQIFALSLIILLVSLCWALSFRQGFQVQRRLPQFGTARQRLEYRLLIENENATMQEDLLVIDELDNSLPDFAEFSASRDPEDKNRNWFDRKLSYPKLVNLINHRRGARVSPVAIDKIPARESIEISIDIRPLRRGYLHFTQAHIARPDPFGLFRALRTIAKRDSLLILPKTYRAPALQLSGARKYQAGGLNQASLVGDSQEFLSLREYRPGDPLRAIHWRSYAKLGRPVVKEFQDEFFVRQGLILDTFMEDGSEAAFEEAVSLAASFVVAKADQDALLDLMLVGVNAYRFSAGRGMNKTENMLEILACVEPCLAQPFSRLEQLLVEHIHETSGVICILLAWDKKRQALIRHILVRELPLYVFVITEQTSGHDELGPMQEHPERLVIMSPDSVQEELDKIR